MRRVLTVLQMLMTAVSLTMIAAGGQKVDVSGMWDLKIESPQGATTPVATIKVDGEKLSGTLKGRRGELPLSGTIKGNEIKLSYTVDFQGNQLTITMTGTVDKDSMKGTADFGGLATGDWSGTRHKEGSAAPAPPASTDASNISGAWIFTVETDQGSGSPSFTFKQEAEKLTGTYKGAFGEAPINGTVKGKEISFSFKVSGQGMDAVMTYTGTIEKDSMKGTVKLGDLGTGTWTAKRQ